MRILVFGKSWISKHGDQIYEKENCGKPICPGAFDLVNERVIPHNMTQENHKLIAKKEREKNSRRGKYPIGSIDFYISGEIKNNKANG